MVRILWFHPRPIPPSTNGGDLRTSGLIESAREHGHDVLLLTPSPGVDDVGSSPMGATFEGHRGLRLNLAKALSFSPLRSPRVPRSERIRLEGQISDFHPEIAVVSEVMSWPVAAQLLPEGLPWIYDAHNVEAPLFDGLYREAQALRDRVTFWVDRGRVRRSEFAMLQRADAIVGVSPADAQILGPMAGGRPVLVVPSSVRIPSGTAEPETSPPTVLFVGTLDYPPNVAALDRLVTKVLDPIRASTPVQLCVVGRRPASRVTELAAQRSWVEVHADVATVDPFYAHARCTVIPMSSGGGTKLKALEALSFGLPVIGTSAAFTGIPVAEADGVVIADSDQALVEATRSLLTDAELAGRLGRAGRQTFVDRLSWRNSAGAFESVIQSTRRLIQPE